VKRAIAIVIACAALSGGSAAAHGIGGLPLRPVARLPLSGPPVRFDYTSMDPTPTIHTLWISHMDANQLLMQIGSTGGPQLLIMKPTWDNFGMPAAPSFAVVLSAFAVTGTGIPGRVMRFTSSGRP
jgi:hypothetical protein